MTGLCSLSTPFCSTEAAYGGHGNRDKLLKENVWCLICTSIFISVASQRGTYQTERYFYCWVQGGDAKMGTQHQRLINQIPGINK